MDNIKEEVKTLVKISEVDVKSHLSELVRNSVEETLNALLDEEADKLVLSGIRCSIMLAATFSCVTLP